MLPAPDCMSVLGDLGYSGFILRRSSSEQRVHTKDFREPVKCKAN
jgi:hypothetical protein